MILIRIHGGLGNQMFQYALGLALSQKHGVSFKLDYSYLKSVNQSGRDFRLFGLSTTADEATTKEIRRYIGTRQKILDRMRSPQNRKRVLEKTLAFNPDILNRNDGYFDGHWQSEKYFTEVTDHVRREFSLRKPFGKAAVEAENTIRGCKNPVSIHIRRGDYVTIPKVAKVHGTLPLSYYEQACERILHEIPDARFFVSSDDINWAREHFPKKYTATFISSSDIADYEELHLMSLCAHHIVANSTFSWWGAWLNQKPAKIVIAPEKWFADKTKNIPDLLPPSWIKI